MKRLSKILISALLVLMSMLYLASCESEALLNTTVEFIVDGEIYHTDTVLKSSKIELPEEPKKEGYEFCGWYLDDESYEEDLTEDYLSGKILIDKVQVFAKWEKLHVHTPGEWIIVTEASCITEGEKTIYCTECEELIESEKIPLNDIHTETEAVTENEVEPTCTEKGSYDSVIYCADCETEIKRETVAVDAFGHTPEEAVPENVLAPTCTEGGSYDSVIYCADCGMELKREAVTLDAFGHSPGDTAKENVVESTCTEEGSYDKIIYCADCGIEIKRESTSLDVIDHIPEVIPAVEATPKADGLSEGSQCSMCGIIIVEQVAVAYNFWGEAESELDAETVSALKDFYTLYDSSIIEWMANLYSPDIGAFYYSNSAKSTVGYLPDIESTSQILYFLRKSGMLVMYDGDLKAAIPEDIAEGIVKFTKSLQDSSDGYFYHPQWGEDIPLSRRMRDLTWATQILRTFGASPYYDTPNGMMKGELTAQTALTIPLSSNSTVAAVSSVVTASATYPAYMESETAFKEYLDEHLGYSSYQSGNMLHAQLHQFISRDEELEAEGADYRLCDMLIDFLAENQDPDTGLWWNTESEITTTRINGLLRISLIYSELGIEMPNIDSAINTVFSFMTSNTGSTIVVDVYNLWYALSNLMKDIRNNRDASVAEEILKEHKEDIVTGLAKCKELLEVYKKPDGAFSYYPEYSSATSQGAPVAVPNTAESDVIATSIATVGTVALICSVLGISDVPIFGAEDFEVFLEHLAECPNPTIKN